MVAESVDRDRGLTSKNKREKKSLKNSWFQKINLYKNNYHFEKILNKIKKIRSINLKIISKNI
jgi:hypothetical protein